uniref:Ubiquitin-like protease family profile domain-containing protein n=1 Tax=Amphimedon queenslandica TaxID=400682 RepID=A0A1X7V148_AMPQE
MGILKYFVLPCYKIDMAVTLEHIAKNDGISTSYGDANSSVKRKRQQKQEDTDDEGPPDKRKQFKTAKDQVVENKKIRNRSGDKEERQSELHHAEEENTTRTRSGNKIDLTKYWLKGLSLFLSEKQNIESGGWISDAVINTAQKLLQNQFPQYNGLQSTLLAQKAHIEVILGKAIQILHINRNHWVCVAVNDNKDVISLYDSLYATIPLALVDCVITLISTSPYF